MGPILNRRHRGANQCSQSFSIAYSTSNVEQSEAKISPLNATFRNGIGILTL